MKTNIIKAVLSFVTTIILPDYILIIWLIIAMIVDLITGIIKARINRQARTAAGYRKWAIKLYQYFSLIAVGMIVTNVAPRQQVPGFETVVIFFTHGVIVYLILTELLSICENIYEVDKESVFARRIVKPLLNIVTFQIKNNPATSIENQNKILHETENV